MNCSFCCVSDRPTEAAGTSTVGYHATRVVAVSVAGWVNARRHDVSLGFGVFV